MGLGNLLLIPGLGTAPLDIRAKVGVSSSPTVTGTQAITGVGFQPKAILPFGSVGLSPGQSTVLSTHIGAATSTTNRAVASVDSQDAVTTTLTNRRHSNATLIEALSGSGTVFLNGNLTAIGADGFTLNWSAVNVSARLFNHICLGGADLEVSLTQHQMNTTNAPQSFAHGLSGAPTGLILFSTHDATVPPNTTATSAMTLGLWSSAAGYASSVWSSSGVTTTATRRMLTNQAVMQFNTTATHTIIRSLAISSVDASNVNVTYPITASTSQAYFFMLAIRGAKCQTGTFKYGTLSPLTINCAGITPRLFLPIFVTVGVDNINTVQNRSTLAIGASDGASTVSAGMLDVDGLTTTNTRRWHSSTSLAEYDSVGGLASEASVGFSGQSVVVTPSTLISSGYGQGAYLIVGA